MAATDLITLWRLRVSRMKDAHYEAATVLQQMHMRLGIPVIVLSAIVGTAVFASLRELAATWVQLAVGLLSIFAAVLASLQTFLRYSERAEHHRVAGAKYGTLKAEIELLETFPPSEEEDLAKKLAEFSVRWSQVRDESPAIPSRLWGRISRTFGPDLDRPEASATSQP